MAEQWARLRVRVKVEVDGALGELVNNSTEVDGSSRVLKASYRQSTALLSQCTTPSPRERVELPGFTSGILPTVASHIRAHVIHESIGYDTDEVLLILPDSCAELQEPKLGASRPSRSILSRTSS
jgi:hypothetical protein